jgi:MFS family permease
VDFQVSLGRFLAIYALNFFRIGYQTVAIAWFATLATSRMNSVAELLLISGVSTLCLSPVIGRLVDRIPRKKALLCMAQLCVMLSGLIAIGFLRFVPFVDSLAVLSVLAFIFSGTSLLASGAMDYFLRTFITDRIRTRYLASINAVTQIALIGGTLVAGVVASYVTIVEGLIVLPLLAALAAILCFIFLPDLRVESCAEYKRNRSGFFRASLYFQFPFIFVIACSSALVFSIGQVTNMLLPGLISMQLKLGSVNYSAVESAWSIGALGVSAWLVVAKIRTQRSLVVDLLIVILMSAALAVVPFAPAFAVLIAVHFGLGIGFAFVRVRMETRFLQECPVHLLGRFRANSMALTSVIGLLIYFVPLVSQHASIASLYLSIGGVILLATMVLLAASASNPFLRDSTISE